MVLVLATNGYQNRHHIYIYIYTYLWYLIIWTLLYELNGCSNGCITDRMIYHVICTLWIPFGYLTEPWKNTILNRWINPLEMWHFPYLCWIARRYLRIFGAICSPSGMGRPHLIFMSETLTETGHRGSYYTSSVQCDSIK